MLKYKQDRVNLQRIVCVLKKGVDFMLALKNWLLANRKFSEDDHVDLLGLAVVGLTISIFTFDFQIFMEQMCYIEGLYFETSKTFPQLIWESPWKILLFCCPALIFWLLSQRKRCQSRLAFLQCLAKIAALLLIMVFITYLDFNYLMTEWSIYYIN